MDERTPTTAAWRVCAVAFAPAIAVLLGCLGMNYYQWHDDKGRHIDFPRCLPWQSINDGCDEFNVPCPPDFGPGARCTHGAALTPGNG